MLLAAESNQLSERLFQACSCSLICKQWGRGELLPISGFLISDLSILKPDSFNSYLVSTHGMSGTAPDLVGPVLKGLTV